MGTNGYAIASVNYLYRRRPDNEVMAFDKYII